MSEDSCVALWDNNLRQLHATTTSSARAGLRNYAVFCLLLTGIVRKTPVHHGHVLLLCGQNSAPRRQQLVARRNSFNKALTTAEEEEEEEEGT